MGERKRERERGREKCACGRVGCGFVFVFCCFCFFVVVFWLLFCCCCCCFLFVFVCLFVFHVSFSSHRPIKPLLFSINVSKLIHRLLVCKSHGQFSSVQLVCRLRTLSSSQMYTLILTNAALTKKFTQMTVIRAIFPRHRNAISAQNAIYPSGDRPSGEGEHFVPVCVARHMVARKFIITQKYARYFCDGFSSSLVR